MVDEVQTEAKPVFAEAPQVHPCSWNECTEGHRWPPTMIVAQCPCCTAPALMVKQENCPFCNEPVVRLNLRSDMVPAGAGVVGRCKGAVPPGESMDLTLDRHIHIDAQEKFKDFEERRKIEESANGREL